MSSDPGVWIAAFLTFCVLSFLIEDNRFFRFAEHLFVGVASGYAFVVAWTKTIRPNLAEPLLDPSRPAAERAVLLIPLALGLCMVARVFPRVAFVSRLSSAFIVGYVVGTNIPTQFQVQVLDQVHATISSRSLATGDVATSVGNLVFVTGVVSVLVFFVFTVPRRETPRRVQRRVADLGRLFLMVAFGATFGNTVMARISILLGRVQFLVRDWLGLGGS